MQQRGELWAKEPPNSVLNKTLDVPGLDKRNYLTFGVYLYPCNDVPVGPTMSSQTNRNRVISKLAGVTCYKPSMIFSPETPRSKSPRATARAIQRRSSGDSKLFRTMTIMSSHFRASGIFAFTFAQGSGA